MANRVRSEAKERLWREHVSSWQRSGLSIRKYCMQHQLSEANLYAWRRELTRRDEVGGAKPIQRAKPSSVTWMPVTVTSSTTPVVEVQLPTGAILRVPAGVDRQTLEGILTALHQTTTQEARP